MNLTQKQKSVKYIILCVLILVANLLQNTSGIIPEICGARFLLVIPTAMILTIGEDELSGALLGLFAGLLWDLTSLVHIGFNCIFFTAVCFISTALVNHFIRDTFITNMLISIITLILYCTVYWLCFIVIKGVGDNIMIFGFYLPCMLYTGVLTPILWLIFKPIKKKLSHK